MNSRYLPVYGVIAFVLAIASLSMFTVGETEFAIRKQFKAIVATDYRPGLHFKWPWDTVNKFDNRLLTQAYTGETFLTNDNLNLIVDFYIKWKIKDPALYFTAANGSEETAGDRLAEIVKDGMKTVVAERSLPQVVSSERAGLTAAMLGQASAKAAALGVELIDVRVQRIDLPEEVAARIYERMKQSFAKDAKQVRAEGEKAATATKAAADRQRTVILADAERDALRVRGEGDAAAAQIYARAYAKNPEFYAFYRSMQAYERSLGNDGDLLVITPDGEFFKYLKDAAPRAAAPATRR
ncbi:MAG TPA: protease modulator HflC [Steroidobacteraceae bacterium]|jgi:membrane protease subunit HflC|nr:protease modulator HflC [Steroidobacteraceae bacterium]